MDPEQKKILLRAFRGIYGLGYLFILIAGILFVIIGSVCVYQDHKRTEGYVETIGRVSRFTESYSLDEDHPYEYNAYYTYVVDGKTYEVKLKEVKYHKESFKKEVKVKYDPENPYRAMAENSMSTNIWCGFGLIALFFILVWKGYHDAKKELEWYEQHPDTIIN